MANTYSLGIRPWAFNSFPVSMADIPFSTVTCLDTPSPWAMGAGAKISWPKL